MYEKSEKRDVMVMINPDSKYDNVDVEKKMIVKKDNLKQVQTEQAMTDPREHYVKGDGLEDAPEDTNKTAEKVFWKGRRRYQKKKLRKKSTMTILGKRAESTS
jgi:hypothetical protein